MKTLVSTLVLGVLAASPAMARDAKDQFIWCQQKAQRDVIVATGRWDAENIARRFMVKCAIPKMNYQTLVGDDEMFAVYKQWTMNGYADFERNGTNALHDLDRFSYHEFWQTDTD